MTEELTERERYLVALALHDYEQKRINERGLTDEVIGLVSRLKLIQFSGEARAPTGTLASSATNPLTPRQRTLLADALYALSERYGGGDMPAEIAIAGGKLGVMHEMLVVSGRAWADAEMAEALGFGRGHKVTREDEERVLAIAGAQLDQVLALNGGVEGLVPVEAEARRPTNTEIHEALNYGKYFGGRP